MVKLDFASPLWRANFQLVHPDDRELLLRVFETWM